MKAQKRRGGSKHPKSVSSDASVLEYKGSDLYVPSDSEDEYSEQEKILLGKVRSNLSRSVVKKKLAVMDIPLDDEDNEDEMEEDRENIEDDVDMDSDIEGKDEDFHLPDQKAWGKTRKNFYNTDYVDQDYGGFDGDDAETAELEEQEALAIQKRLAAELDDNDFTLDVFTKSHEDVKAVEKHSEEVIKTDLSQLSTRQKLALLQKEAPELTGIISEFRDVMEDLQNNLQPAMTLVQRGQVSSPELIQYIRTKYHLLNNYALNMGFYLLLRARRLPVSAHPVVKRLLQYRQLLQQLDPLNKLAVSQIEELLNAWKNGSLLTLQGNDLHDMKIKNKEQPIFLSRIFRKGEWAEPNNVGSTPQVSPITRDRHKVITKGINEQASPEMSQENSLDLDRNEDLLTHEVTSGDEMANVIGSEDLVGSLEDAEGNSKRGITWQIAKNKGLTPHRKKEQRNPRVKHRNKFRKAKIRRKGQVREPRTEIKRYGGEFSGIKKCVSKSIKIK